ncbi:MAG TPA: hypothetical protein DCE42_10410 [Myxococcales bacterium]|nr:hypothetical protein [Deltaproteobacteria bacterium]MBU54082.1 hypothetical protein [Deltaproteobacteria bacterium]HAA55161.1 hypothetical protein [Myxococcales bacterium]|tara:strand:- start:28489 stop:30918 length:2430 start_codon:yes stop_codon:yes gene_type:complete
MSLHLTSLLYDKDISPHTLLTHSISGNTIDHDALCAIIDTHKNARLVSIAIQKLPHPLSAVAQQRCIDALRSPHSAVRRNALRQLSSASEHTHNALFAHHLRHDPAWTIRQDCLAYLADTPDGYEDTFFFATSDPHWRVRRDLLRCWKTWQTTHTAVARRLKQQLEETLSPTPQQAGCLHYMCLPQGPPAIDWEDPRWTSLRSQPWWDEDPPVLHKRLTRLSRKQAKDAVSHFPTLLLHEDERVRTKATQYLRKYGSHQDIITCLTLLKEPRLTFVKEHIEHFWRTFNLDRREYIVLSMLEATPLPLHLHRWLLEQLALLPDELFEEQPSLLERCLSWSCTTPLLESKALNAIPYSQRTSEEWWDTLRTSTSEETHMIVWQKLRKQCTFDELRQRLSPEQCKTLFWQKEIAQLWIHQAKQGHPPHTESLPEGLWRTLGNAKEADARGLAAQGLCLQHEHTDTDIELLTSLQRDPDYKVRIRALTPAHAVWLWQDIERETSWLVLEAAARMASVCPLHLETPSAPTQALPQTPPLTLSTWSLHPNHRPLGATGLKISCMGISGHYGLSEEGFGHAWDRGVNLYFWEPDYRSQSRFFQQLTPAQRRQTVVVCGTFEATPKAIRRDIELALTSLKLETIPLFFLFWVRSKGRLDDEVMGTLTRLREEGKLLHAGLSTHQRPLACDAIEDGWEPVMVRHNIAHRGAEEQVFPLAQARGCGVLTFNNLIYGRLLQMPYADSLQPPTPQDCYRYTLSQEAVSGCFSAPRDQQQLRENLEVLDESRLSEEKRARLRAFGDIFVKKNRAFAKDIRNR